MKKTIQIILKGFLVTVLFSFLFFLNFFNTASVYATFNSCEAYATFGILEYAIYDPVMPGGTTNYSIPYSGTDVITFDNNCHITSYYNSAVGSTIITNIAPGSDYVVLGGPLPKTLYNISLENAYDATRGVPTGNCAATFDTSYSNYKTVTSLPDGSFSGHYDGCYYRAGNFDSNCNLISRCIGWDGNCSAACGALNDNTTIYLPGEGVQFFSMFGDATVWINATPFNWTCPSGGVLTQKIDNIFIGDLRPAERNLIPYACVQPTFTCTGTDPTNATMCSGDDVGLTTNTPKTTASSCTAPTKCEFTCNSGFNISGGVCVPIVYTCTGSDPVNATMCSGDDVGLTTNTPKTTASSCTAPTKCEFTCNSGFNLSGGVCVLIDSNPPNIEITSPTINSFYTTNLSSINISGTASDNEGAIQQTVLRNLTTGDSWSVGLGATWSRNNVPLVYGQNIIEATATDLASNTSTDTLIINRLPPNGELIGYAWTDTIGWISMSSKNHITAPIYYNVVVNPQTGHLSGYGWSENVGWVSFQNENLPDFPNITTPDSNAFNVNCYNDQVVGNDCLQSNNCIACYNPKAEVIPGTGGLYGWARVLSLGDKGFIRLDDDNPSSNPAYGVKYNLSNNEFYGYAWNGNQIPNDYTGIGWVSFNCIDSGNNCAVSNYKVMADLNMPPVITFNESNPANELPCGAEEACVSDCELNPVVKWIYDDPEGYDQYAYSLILRDDGLLPGAPGSLINIPKTLGDTSEIALNDYYTDQFTYGTNYSVHIMVWDNFDRPSDWLSRNFTTHNNKFPEPYFNWFVPNASREEEILFWDTSIYYPNSIGTRNNTPSTPGSCQVPTCAYDWTSTSLPITISDPELATTTATFGLKGNGQNMTLEVTDGNSYSCSTSTNSININERLPSWIER